MSASEKSIVVCPGSYDPITNGHLDVIRRAGVLYDEVVVAVVNRSVRKDKALFGIDERMGFIEHAIADLEGVRAEPFSTLVVEFARLVGAKAIVKGLRAIPGITCTLPEGAFYSYPNISAFLGRGGLKSAADVAGRLLREVHVATVPGEGFGTSEHIRVSYATSKAELDRGLERMRKFFAAV